jgi:hypothetical protein
MRNGREVVIQRDGVDVLADFLDVINPEIDEDVMMQISSKFSNEVGTTPDQNLQTAYQLFNKYVMKKDGNQTLHHALSGATVWTGADPITFNIALTFHVGTNGRYDPKRQVYDPMRALCKLPLPFEGERGFLKAPGLMSWEILTDMTQEILNIDSDPSPNTIFSLSIGNIIRFNRVIISNAQPTFSKQMAKDSSGNFYPIHGRVDLVISTLRVGTTNMIDDMGGVL